MPHLISKVSHVYRTVSQNGSLKNRARDIHTWTLPSKNDPPTTSSYAEMRNLFLVLFLILVRQRDLTAAVSPLPESQDFRRLFCPNPLPDPEWMFGDTGEGWAMTSIRIQLGLEPQSWSSRNFTSLEDLCSMRGNQQANMGGRVRAHSIRP